MPLKAYLPPSHPTQSQKKPTFKPFQWYQIPHLQARTTPSQFEDDERQRYVKTSHQLKRVECIV